MFYYTLGSIAVIVILTLWAGSIALQIIKSDSRGERIDKIRNFKKGKFLAIYPIAIPIYFMAILYGKELSKANIFECFLEAITKAAQLVSVRFAFSDLKGLMDASFLFTVCVYYCYILILLNVVLFILSLFMQFLWEHISILEYERYHGDKYLVIGNNEGNRKLYASIKTGKKALVDNISKETALELYGLGIVNYSRENLAKFAAGKLDESYRQIVSDKAGKISIVVNTEDDEENLEIAMALTKKLETLEKEMPADDIYSRINIYIFGNPQFESLYEEITNAFGCIRLVDKYKKIATKVAMEYPIAKFLNEDTVDYSTGLLKPDVNINVVFLGFGDVNKQLFLTYAATNQFIEKVGDEVKLKQVNYHFFDKEKAYHNKNLNNSFYRYRNEFYNFDKASLDYKPMVNEEDYLPLPDLPSREIYHPTDINSPDFYRDIKKIVKASENGAMLVFVAYGSDLENRDLARKLSLMINGWKKKDNVAIFARKRMSDEDEPEIKKGEYISFGLEDEAVFDMDNLDDSEEMRMTLYRHKSYALEGELRRRELEGLPAPTEEEIDEIVKASEKRWYVADGLKERSYRDSSRYATMSLRAKLLMMGLDMVPKGAAGADGAEAAVAGLSRDEYVESYAGADKADYYSIEYKGQKYEFSKRTSVDFMEDTKPYYMSIEEHFRWNAYIISQGFVPAKLKRIKNGADHGKNYTLRLHNNLTTYEGLKDYRRIMCEINGGSEEENDVIHYDYQILDDAWQMLDNLGYNIRKR